MKTKTKSKATGGRSRAVLPGDDKPAAAARKRGRKQKGRKPGTTNKRFGLPVKEAKQDMLIPLLQIDTEKAAENKPSDVNSEDNFLSCVIAQAVTRACGAERVWIGRRTAYVAYPGDGCARRYLIDNHSRTILEKWDRGEDIKEGVGLKLRAPNKRHTRAELRRKNAEYGERMRGKARPISKRKQRESDPLHNIVRNGNLVRWS